jgi:curli production assembly/transport component CsgF
MLPGKQLRADRSFIRKAAAALVGAAFSSFLLVSEAGAQELTHRFINPSFGGNPFYSDHLLGTANIHRPDEPEEPEEPPISEEELLASNLRSRFLSQTQSQILDAIQNAQPGQSGEFTLGDQRISFTRTATETRVTFFNPRTNETRVVVIPVTSSGGSRFGFGAPAVSATGRASASAEQALGSLGSTPARPPIGAMSPGLGSITAESRLGVPPL